jgi:hypothetical protein
MEISNIGGDAAIPLPVSQEVADRPEEAERSAPPPPSEDSGKTIDLYV